MTESPHPSVELDGETLALLPGESVLEALERNGVDAASGCRAGTCCKCMLRGNDPPPEAQRTLRPTLRAQGFFLACQARPEGKLVVQGAEAPSPVRATVTRIEHETTDVVRLWLEPHDELPYRPGQYIDVRHSNGEWRSYSVASLPADGALELHVRRVPDGLVSSWLHERVPGDVVTIRGAFGQCFHVADDSAKPLLLVGSGTGLAPLLGIARDALNQGHVGRIDLVHGGLRPDRLYLRKELADLAARWPGLHVHHCVLQEATEREHEGRLDEVAIRLAGPLEDKRVFLCGDAELVRSLQRSLFMAGAASHEILADPFLPART